MNIELILSIWGASLSTILASVNLYQNYRSRTRLLSGYYFDGSEEGEDNIIIYNLGKVDILINDYKLFFARNAWFGKKDYFENSAIDDLIMGDVISINIKANDKKTLSFKEFNRINWAKKRNRKLYIELSIVGRRRKKTLKIC